MYVDKNNDNNYLTIAGGALGAAVTAPGLIADTIGQVDLLRHSKKIKPLLKADTFEYLQKNEKPEVFKYITENKKLLYSPLLKKLGITSAAVVGGIIVGKLIDKIFSTY